MTSASRYFVCLGLAAGRDPGCDFSRRPGRISLDRPCLRGCVIARSAPSPRSPIRGRNRTSGGPPDSSIAPRTRRWASERMCVSSAAWDSHISTSTTASSGPRVRAGGLPPGTHPGLLFALADLVRAGVEAGRAPGSEGPLPRRVQYTFNAGVYDLVVTSWERVERARYAKRTYEKLVRLEFASRNLEKGTTERFVLACGTEGASPGSRSSCATSRSGGSRSRVCSTRMRPCEGSRLRDGRVAPGRFFRPGAAGPGPRPAGLRGHPGEIGGVAVLVGRQGKLTAPAPGPSPGWMYDDR